jgi:putative spermidine/putrescine transport system permease protein
MQQGAVIAAGRQTSTPTRRLLLLAPALLFLAVFLVAPMLGLFRTSFYPGNRSFGASGFSLHQYVKFLGDSYYLGVLAETIGFGIASAFVSLLVGFPIGYSLARLPREKRRWRLIVVILPLTLSLVVVVFGWLVLLGRTGLANAILIGLGLVDEPQRLLFNRTAVLVVLVQQFLPFMILSVMSVVTQISPALEQAAANLRANRFTTFRRIVLPLAMPGILSGLTLVFILSASAFITPRLIGGARVQMVGSLIFEQVLAILNWPFGAAMAFVLLVLTLAVTIAVNMALAGRFYGKGLARAR